MTPNSVAGMWDRQHIIFDLLLALEIGVAAENELSQRFANENTCFRRATAGGDPSERPQSRCRRRLSGGIAAPRPVSFIVRALKAS
jgi:hypothetical protein